MPTRPRSHEEKAAEPRFEPGLSGPKATASGSRDRGVGLGDPVLSSPARRSRDADVWGVCDCSSVYDVHVWCVVCGAVCACGVRCVWYACRGVYPACGLCVRTGVVESVQCACLMNKVFLISYLPGMCKRTRLRQTPGFGIGQRSVRKPWRTARAEAASGRSASSPGSRSPCSSSFPPLRPRRCEAHCPPTSTWGRDAPGRPVLKERLLRLQRKTR